MGVVHYVWDDVNDSLLEEVDDSGNVIASYTNEPGPFGKVISQERNGVTSYYHYDGQGSTVALTDDNENVTDTYVYNAFGETVASTGTTENSFRYVGQYGYYTDSETNDIYVRARNYLHSLGRWSSRDPIRYLGVHESLFEYCNNNPIACMDPKGTYAITIWPIPYGPGTHVELQIEEDGVRTIIDGTASNDLEIDTLPPYVNPKRGKRPILELKDLSSEQVACIRQSDDEWNKVPVIQRRRFSAYTCPNSNWVLKCVLKRCGVTVNWGSYGKPYCWDSTTPICLKWNYFDVNIPKEGNCRTKICVEYQECPDGFDKPVIAKKLLP